MVGKFPKLALMGCCVIAMLMKGDGMYFMNVGHSHAVLGTMDSADLLQINVGSFHGLVGDCSRCLSAVQIIGEHSTSVQPEVYRIRNDHPDNPSAISKDRVEGSIKVTRAFGAGFLKQMERWKSVIKGDPEVDTQKRRRVVYLAIIVPRFSRIQRVGLRLYIQIETSIFCTFFIITELSWDVQVKSSNFCAMDKSGGTFCFRNVAPDARTGSPLKQEKQCLMQSGRQRDCMQLVNQF